MKQTLTDAEIRERAPSVFAKRPAHQMSDRYQFVNTAAIVSMMRDSGYEVTRATQDSATRRDSAFVRHSITMRWSESDLVVGECIPQLLLTNAHNGCSSLRVTLGLYRVLCENGLLVAAESSVAIVRHSKSPLEDAVAWLKDSVLRLSSAEQTVRSWMGTELTDEQARSFAVAAAKLRFGLDKMNSYPVCRLLEARRTEDEGHSLWKVFNRVQENTTKPGLVGRSAHGRPIATRALNGITQDWKYNLQLWRLAASYASKAANN